MFHTGSSLLSSWRWDFPLTFCFVSNRIKSFEFPEVGFSFDIPRILTLSSCALRYLHTKFDHFSPYSKAFYPRRKKKEEGELLSSSIILYHPVSACIVLYCLVSSCIILYHLVSACIILYHFVSSWLCFFIPSFPASLFYPHPPPIPYPLNLPNKHFLRQK